jgi:hypothetical protein
MNRKSVLSNCEQCGELHANASHKLCQSCQLKDNEILESLCCYLKTKPQMHVDELLEKTDLPGDTIKRFINNGKLWSFSNLRVNCKLCGKEINLSCGKLICYTCYTSLAKETSSAQKIERLRKTLKERDRYQREYSKYSGEQSDKRRKYGFKSTFKDQLAKYTTAKEAELLPDIMKDSPIKLSNDLKMSPILIYG